MNFANKKAEEIYNKIQEGKKKTERMERLMEEKNEVSGDDKVWYKAEENETSRDKNSLSLLL